MKSPKVLTHPSPSPYLKYPTTLRSVGSLVLSQGKQEIAQIQGFCK